MPDLAGWFGCRFVSMKGKFPRGAGIPEPFLSQPAQSQKLRPHHGEPLPGQGWPREVLWKYPEELQPGWVLAR